MENQEIIKLKLDDEIYDCYLEIGRYQNNDRLYLGLSTPFSSFSDITVNLPDTPIIGDNMIFVDGDLTLDLKKQLEKYGILSEYLYTENYNMGSYDCYLVNLDKLKYYDPKGFEEAGLKLYEDKNENYDLKI